VGKVYFHGTHLYGYEEKMKQIVKGLKEGLFWANNEAVK